MCLIGLIAYHLVFSTVGLGRLTSFFCATFVMSKGCDLLSVALKKPMTSLFQQCNTHPLTHPADFYIMESFLFSLPVCPLAITFPLVTIISKWWTCLENGGSICHCGICDCLALPNCSMIPCLTLLCLTQALNPFHLWETSLSETPGSPVFAVSWLPSIFYSIAKLLSHDCHSISMRKLHLLLALQTPSQNMPNSTSAGYWHTTVTLQ